MDHSLECGSTDYFAKGQNNNENDARSIITTSDTTTVLTASETVGTESETTVSSASRLDDNRSGNHNIIHNDPADDYHGDNDINNTSRTGNTKSDPIRSNSNSNSNSSNINSRSSMFEINCSPMNPNSSSGKSYREQTRRWKQQEQKQSSKQRHDDSSEGKIIPLYQLNRAAQLQSQSSQSQPSQTIPTPTPKNYVVPASNDSTQQILKQWGRTSNASEQHQKQELHHPNVVPPPLNAQNNGAEDTVAVNATIAAQEGGKSSGNNHNSQLQLNEIKHVHETSDFQNNYPQRDDDDYDFDENNYNNNDDNDSCCTLADSEMYHNSNFIYADRDADDNTIATSNMVESSNIDSNSMVESSNIDSNSMVESSNIDSNSMVESSNIDSNSSVHNINSSNSTANATSTETYSGSVATNASDMANSICSSVSRGEEHISSRLKKYGLFNLNQMKRRQQQRRASRSHNNNNKNDVIHHNNKNNFNTSKTSLAVSILSGLTGDGEEASSMLESVDVSGIPNPSSNSNSSNNTGAGIPTRIRTAPLHVQMAVEEIHRWLFTEGGHFEDVQTLMTQYSLYVREHFGIPLDRLYYGGVGLHPKLTAYLWKWEPYGEFTHSEMPPEVFARRNEIFSPDEPFCVLEQGRADFVRIRDTDTYIPPDTAKWFRSGKYKDYFALPDVHRGISKGGLAWSTKFQNGFCDDDIQFFRMTHPALTTIMRLHTNDMVLKTLTDRMEAEIMDRTTELGTANRKLEEANEEISRHSSKQLEHFACMSHEIRTPLNCIVGLSSLLLENDDLNEDLLDTINMVYNSADLVQGVVNDVLDYAKIESGHFELDVHAIDLQSTLNGVVHSISNKLRTQEKNVEVRTSYCGRLGKTMTTDSRRLQQILYNILGNASKFSREGTTIDFRVRIMLATDDSDSKDDDINDGESALSNSPNKIRFSIKDYGKGIEEKDFGKIFQPFSQASKETQTIYGGTGLGLSITKKLVTRLGGTISIKSEIDKFTEFIVDLPYKDDLIDISGYRHDMSETSIVILDPTKRPADALPLEEDEFVPFPTTVIKQYDLNVLRCSNWGELESKLGLRANVKENYVFLAHEDIEEHEALLRMEKFVDRKRCSWFSLGLENPLNQQRRFKTLTGIFPVTLIDKIIFNSLNSSNGQFLVRSRSESEETEDGKQKIDICSIGPSGASSVAVVPATESASPPPDDSKNNIASRYPPRALKVLVVDDNVINQKILDRMLKRLGVTDIAIVDNGKKAVDITETTSFSCILMDMEMPVMGGLEACKLIVARDKEAARVVFVTAHDIEDIKEKADAAGAFGYISKPLKMQEINNFLTTIESLKIVTTNSQRTKMKNSGEARKKRAAPPKKMRCTKQYPARDIKVLMAEDNIINQKVLDRILKRVGVTDVTIVDNGKKAVDASATTKFDCILMDMQMPVMDGLEACKIIVERDKDKDDPPKVVFVTAHALVEFKGKALAAGGFDFIAKPFKMADIDNLMKTLEGTKSTDLSSTHLKSESISLEEKPTTNTPSPSMDSTHSNVQTQLPSRST